MTRLKRLILAALLWGSPAFALESFLTSTVVPTTSAETELTDLDVTDNVVDETDRQRFVLFSADVFISGNRDQQITLRVKRDGNTIAQDTILVPAGQARTIQLPVTDTGIPIGNATWEAFVVKGGTNAASFVAPSTFLGVYNQDPDIFISQTIGNIVGGGTPQSVIFLDVNGDLAEDNPAFTFNESTDQLTLGDITLRNDTLTFTDTSVFGQIKSNSSIVIQPDADSNGVEDVFFRDGAGTTLMSINEASTGIVTIPGAASQFIAGNTISATGGYIDNGNAGIDLNCASGEFVDDATVSGGIVTAGSCTTESSGSGAISFDATNDASNESTALTHLECSGNGLSCSEPSPDEAQIALNIGTGASQVAAGDHTQAFAKGGTGLTSASDDTVMVSNGSAWQAKTIPDCDDVSGKHLNYDQTTNAWSCGTTGAASTLPVTDTTSVVEGSSDPTKEIRFEVDGLTTSTTRVLTPPDANITIAGQNFANNFTANQTIDNAQELRFGEDDGNGSNYISVKAPADITSNINCTLENDSTPFDSCVTGGGGGSAISFDAENDAVNESTGLVHLECNGNGLACNEPSNDQAQIALDIGTGATQVAAGNHTHAATVPSSPGFEQVAGCTSASGGVIANGWMATASVSYSCSSGSRAAVNLDANTDESIQKVLELPSDYSSEAAINVVIYWHEFTTSGAVVWAVETSCFALGDAFPAAPTFNTASTTTATLSSPATQFYSNEFATVDMTGCDPDEYVFVRVRRDADNGSDTLGNDVDLFAVKITIPTS